MWKENLKNVAGVASVSTLVSTVASRFGSDSLGARGFACSPHVFVGALRVLQLPPQTSIWSYLATVK